MAPTSDSPYSVTEARERLLSIQEQIKNALKLAGRSPGEVTLLAVSKTFPASAVQSFFDAGQINFGESYIQEARDKVPLVPGATWHFIGHLQSNKARYAATLFSHIHALDNLDTAAELNKRLIALKKTLKAYIQVNVSGEDQKSGIPPADLPNFLDALAPYVAVEPVGLMTLPPYDPDPEVSRPYFRALYELQQKHAPNLPGLSMGMSGDFPVAISEGATIVRVGTLLFGERQKP
ncbi:MAG: YggS family pyridoxal phosphate-dependent enzyme [Deltaproteobacteria bacterium]|nr:YggS family pyridoxal phosphate-dependent enzyme [Deltaproteobacteria bacterium]